MDKRYKWSVSQQRGGGYLEPPTYGPRCTYQLPFKNYSRLNHSYSYGKHNNASTPGNKNYYNKPPPPPPPPPSHARESGAGGGSWLPGESETVSTNSSEVVTLIVENNNLKRMILLHMNLMQEQTDQLKGKDKELDDQNGRIKSLLSHNQELMQQIAKLSQRIEDLRNQLRRCVKRAANDDEEQQLSVPKTKIPCYVEKETQTLEILEEAPLIESYTHHQTQLEPSPKVLVTSVTDLPSTTPVATILDTSKGRGEFNGGKKVSTIFLHRVHQEKTSFQLQDEEQQLEEDKLEQEPDVEEEVAEEVDWQLHIEEEVHEEHIYHDAQEMEVVTETEIGAEHVLGAEETADDSDVINNGHIYEEEVEQEEIIINNCETNNFWEQQATHVNEATVEEEVEDEPAEEEEPIEEEEVVEEENQHQIYMTEADEEVALVTPFAHSTPHPKQAQLQKEKLQLESQISQDEEEQLEQNQELHSEQQLRNKLKVDDEEEQQKLIEQECQQIIMKNEVKAQKVEVQSVELLHAVHTDSAQEVSHPKVHNKNTDTGTTLKTKATSETVVAQKVKSTKLIANHQATKGIVAKSKQQSKGTQKSIERESIKEQEERELQEERERELKKKERELKKKQEKEKRLQKEKELERERERERERDRLLKERERKKREQSKRELEKQQSKQQQKQQQQQEKPDPNIEEETMRKLQEHLQKQQQRLQTQQNQPLVRIKKSPMQMQNTSLIYPPIAPTATITPAPSPSPTHAASPKLKLSNNNNNNSSSTTAATTTTIQTPLTPQSISSVGSNSNNSNSNNNNKRTVVNNCTTPQAYSKSPSKSNSTPSTSIFKTTLQPYTTRSWEDQEFHCDNEFFLEEADELLADNPSLEIPKWKVINLRRSPDNYNIETLTNVTYEDRHEKYVREEKERKRRDERATREQIRINELRSRHNQDEVLVALDPLPTSTFYPLPNDIEGIQFVTEVPVQAFGENMPNLQEQNDFTLPWLEAQTATNAIAKAKAEAHPVVTLDSKKLPTTHAEAKVLQKNSSYVFLKLRKRQRRR